MSFATRPVAQALPQLGTRANALLKIIGSVFARAFALVLVRWCWEFTAFAWKRTSELADLPLWLIHIAWPLTGMTWLLFQGEHLLRAIRVLQGRTPV